MDKSNFKEIKTNQSLWKAGNTKLHWCNLSFFSTYVLKTYGCTIRHIKCNYSEFDRDLEMHYQPRRWGHLNVRDFASFQVPQGQMDFNCLYRMTLSEESSWHQCHCLYPREDGIDTTALGPPLSRSQCLAT